MYISKIQDMMALKSLHENLNCNHNPPKKINRINKVYKVESVFFLHVYIEAIDVAIIKRTFNALREPAKKSFF